MRADEVDYVIGADTHRDQHTLAVVIASAGAVVAQSSVRADRRGYRAALATAGQCAGGVRVWAVEGSGHYGAGLTRFLSVRGEAVVEAGRSPCAERRLRGKNDPLDAVRAARSVLAAETMATPRSGERQEAMRVLLLARRSAVDVRRLALVQLRSVIVTAPEGVREELRAEGQALADEEADEIARLSWNELDAYGERADQGTTPSGRVVGVSSRAYWDVEPGVREARSSDRPRTRRQHTRSTVVHTTTD